MQRPETIEQTASLVTEAGGRGISVQCDHSDPEAVRVLVDRIRREAGALDILALVVWGGDPFVHFGKPLWECPLDDTLRVVRNGVETHLITAHFAVPLVLQSTAPGGGLVIVVGDGQGHVPYRGNMAYDHVKQAVVRLGMGLDVELRGHGALALSVTPGFLRSEAMLETFGVTEENWKDAFLKAGKHWLYSETPALLGRGIAALAADADKKRFAGRDLGSWDLMHTYGIVDADGARPDWGAVDTECRADALREEFPSFTAGSRSNTPGLGHKQP